MGIDALRERARIDALRGHASISPLRERARIDALRVRARIEPPQDRTTKIAVKLSKHRGRDAVNVHST